MGLLDRDNFLLWQLAEEMFGSGGQKRRAAGTYTKPYDTPPRRAAGTYTTPYDAPLRQAAGTPTAPYDVPPRQAAGTYTAPYDVAPRQAAGTFTAPYDVAPRQAAGTFTAPYDRPNAAPQGQGGAAPASARRGFLSGFFGPEGRDMRQRLAMGLEGMTLNPNQALIQSIQADMDGRKQLEAVNRTAAWLEAQGRPDLAEAVRGGLIDGAAAFNTMTAKSEKTALQQNVEFLVAQGYSLQDAIKAVQGASGGSSISIGSNGIDYGAPPKDMAWARNPDGSVKLDERGVPVALPIQNTPLATDQAAAEVKGDQKDENEQTYGGAAVRAIDMLIGDGQKPGMLDSQGMFDLPQAGIVGSRLADWGLNQEAVNVKNTLETVTSNIAFDRLQAMRDASATGGALGSVTENELSMLMNSLGAVKQNTDPAILKENLKEIRRIWTKINQDPIARQYYYGAGQQGAAAPAAGGDGFSVTGQIGG